MIWRWSRRRVGVEIMVNPKVSNIAADPSQARPARQVCAATPRARYEGREPAGQSGGPARDGEQQARPRSRGSHLAIDLEGPRAGGAIHESERERAEHESRSPPMWQPRHRRASHRRAPRGDPRRQHSSRREAPPLFSKVGATHGHLRGVRSTGRPGSARRARRTRALAQSSPAAVASVETLRPRPTLVPRDRPGLMSRVLTFADEKGLGENVSRRGVGVEILVNPMVSTSLPSEPRFGPPARWARQLREQGRGARAGRAIWRASARRASNKRDDDRGAIISRSISRRERWRGDFRERARAHRA